MADDAFFRGRKAAAVLKHGVVSRYVLPFATKVGTTSVGNRVVVLDGYAGEGRYEDGTPGSPIFFAEAARNLAAPRRMDLIFIEEKKQRYQKLCETLAQEASDLDYEVWHGSVGDHLDDVLNRAAGVPFFAFLDPCGVGLPFTDIAEQIFGRPDHQYAPATEVLLNFSAEAVRRIGGRLKEQEDAQGRAATLARMDTACGGAWWRDVYSNAESPERANEQIASGFASRLREATGTGSWVIEVRNAEHQQPKYALVFLSRHPDGLYLYGDAMSLSQQDWRRAVVPPGSLLDDEDAFKAAEQEMAEQWVEEIAANIEDLVQTHSSFRISSQYGKVMGGTLGRAREKHLRSALKHLQGTGVLSSNCVGVSKLQNHTVTKASARRFGVGISSQVRPWRRRPPDFGRSPPHCLKKNAVSDAAQSCCRAVTHLGSTCRCPTPLSPPAISQSMPRRSRETGPRSGSALMNRTAAGTSRRTSALQAVCWSSTVTPIHTFSGHGNDEAKRATRRGRLVRIW